MSTFFKAFAERRKNLKSVLCAGIDPVADRLPVGYIKRCNRLVGFHK